MTGETPEAGAGRAQDAKGPGRVRPTAVDGGRRRGAILGIALLAAVLVVLAVVAVVAGDDDEEESTRTAGAPPSETTEEPTETSQRPATAPTTEPAAPARPSAADDLAPFFAAADTLDQQLHQAAAAINRAGPPWTDVSPEVNATVEAASLQPVAESIPAGLPPELLRSVVLVYSDLSSRRFAMSTFALPWEQGYGRDTAVRLEELANGHEAAERFDDDLAAARSRAASTPPITPPPPDARERAEVMLLTQFVDGNNGGCAGHGGFIVTELPPITWAAEPPDDPAAPEGTIASAGFTAELVDGTWDVRILAC